MAGPSSRPRVRLNKEGSIFLASYARTLSAYPSRAEKEALVASLRAIPGNEGFTYQKLNNWFIRHRSSAESRVLIDDETVLFPRLTPTHLQQLRVLYKKRPDPSEPIITFWAERLKADREDVTAWIQYQQTKAREDEARTTPESPDIPLQQLVTSTSVSPPCPRPPRPPRPHLPTPPSTSPQTRMLSLPPIAVKLEDARQCLSPLEAISASIPPLSRHLQQVSPVSPSRPPRQDPTKALAASIRASVRHATPREQPPRTADEFSQQFERVEKMINAFMTQYDSGRLAPLGWDSSVS